MKALNELVKTIATYETKNIKRILKGGGAFPYVLFVYFPEDDTSNIHFVKSGDATNSGYSQTQNEQRAYKIEDVKQALEEVA